MYTPLIPSFSQREKGFFVYRLCLPKRNDTGNGSCCRNTGEGARCARSLSTWNRCRQRPLHHRIECPHEPLHRIGIGAGLAQGCVDLAVCEVFALYLGAHPEHTGLGGKAAGLWTGVVAARGADQQDRAGRRRQRVLGRRFAPVGRVAAGGVVVEPDVRALRDLHQLAGCTVQEDGAQHGRATGLWRGGG